MTCAYGQAVAHMTGRDCRKHTRNQNVVASQKWLIIRYPKQAMAHQQEKRTLPLLSGILAVPQHPHPSGHQSLQSQPERHHLCQTPAEVQCFRQLSMYGQNDGSYVETPNQQLKQVHT